MYTICLVEDEMDLASLIRTYLEKAGYKVVQFREGKDALSYIGSPVDLWILDIMLSDDVTGYDIIKKIRESDTTIPVIFTSARDQDLDKIIGLELGSDDYITKPYSPKELVLRVNNIIKRVYKEAKTNKIQYENYYSIDTDKRIVLEQEKEITTEENQTVTFAGLTKYDENGNLMCPNGRKFKFKYNLHIKGFEGLDFNVINKSNYEITYSKDIKDSYSNFLSNFDVTNKEEFNAIINEADEIFSNINRKTTVYLIPYMKNIYQNKEKYFDENKFQLISTEVWQTYTNFDKLNELKTNCSFSITLEPTTDMEKYADFVMQGYQSGDDEDPYGDLDDGYRQGYINYTEIHNDIKTEFYLIKADDEIVGTTQSVYNNELYGIYSLALKKDYRGKGIGKEVLKQQLEMCKNKNIKVAYLQTEQDFYPAQMYRKLGFNDLCEVYYYLKK